MSNVKNLKRGEILFKEGDKITNLYLIQSGAITQCILRPKKTVDLFSLGVSHLLGEQIVLGQTNYSMSAMATAETKALEIPIDSLKDQYETSPQIVKLLVKSLAERIRLLAQEIKSSKMEKDNTPCPDDQIARVFGSIYHTTAHKSEKNKLGYFTLDWNYLRQYSQRIFGESLKRLENACHLLVKLKLASYEVGKSPDNPDGPDEIQKILIPSLEPIQNFFEFFQYHYFKNGRTDILKVEETYLNILEIFVKMSSDQEPDRFGIVSLDLNQITTLCKDELDIVLNQTYLSRLEQKGIFMKRRNEGDGRNTMQFDKKEFNSVLMNWKFIREIDRWNEMGFVDPNEKEAQKKSKKNIASNGSIICPSCSASLVSTAKFCSECGAKIIEAA